MRTFLQPVELIGMFITLQNFGFAVMREFGRRLIDRPLDDSGRRFEWANMKPNEWDTERGQFVHTTEEIRAFLRAGIDSYCLKLFRSERGKHYDDLSPLTDQELLACRDEFSEVFGPAARRELIGSIGPDGRHWRAKAFIGDDRRHIVIRFSRPAKSNLPMRWL